MTHATQQAKTFRGYARLSCALVFHLAVLILLSQSLSAEKTMAEVFYKRGKKLLSKKDYIEAEKLFLRALDEDSEYVPALYSLGVTYVKQEDVERALEIFSGLEKSLEKRDAKDKERKKFLKKNHKKDQNPHQRERGH